jgi:hypothetical protein
MYAGMRDAGLTVESLETRHVRDAFKAMPVKTDRKDARGIAQLMRLGWFRPVHCKSLPAQEVRALLALQRHQHRRFKQPMGGGIVDLPAPIQQPESTAAAPDTNSSSWQDEVAEGVKKLVRQRGFSTGGPLPARALVESRRRAGLKPLIPTSPRAKACAIFARRRANGIARKPSGLGRTRACRLISEKRRSAFAEILLMFV